MNLNSIQAKEFCRMHKEVMLFSAPGRTELSGNHTDHQHGRVLAAAINLETEALVSVNSENCIYVRSNGFGETVIDLNDLEKKANEVNTTAALIRGIASAFQQRGEKIGGVSVYCESSVLPGSGLSSSAAFEVLIGTILNVLFCGGKYSQVEIAQIGQYAENVYFGKPCGLMDQTACAVGNIIGIDFEDPSLPIVRKIDFDFSSTGYALCIIDSGADHADLTDEYASIPTEMRAVAGVFGKEVLRDVNPKDFYAHIREAKAAAGDRAVLRSIHFMEENERVKKQIEALDRNDFNEFLKYVRESGRSSWMLLQNVIPSGNKAHQELALALSVAEHILGDEGAVRVHGGGFAGTLQAFVPLNKLDGFKDQMEKVLGEGKCHVLSIRPEGSILVKKL